LAHQIVVTGGGTERQGCGLTGRRWLIRRHILYLGTPLAWRQLLGTFAGIFDRRPAIVATALVIVGVQC
jgi:hypothetical protein